jgi:hypothetical protein
MFTARCRWPFALQESTCEKEIYFNNKNKTPLSPVCAKYKTDKAAQPNQDKLMHQIRMQPTIKKVAGKF